MKILLDHGSRAYLIERDELLQYASGGPTDDGRRSARSQQTLRIRDHDGNMFEVPLEALKNHLIPAGERTRLLDEMEREALPDHRAELPSPRTSSHSYVWF